jgi:hypothetical protein
MSNTNLRIDGLDFDAIKSNLKTYLRSQDQFKDFDFEGSGMNIILDLLAYNTHYQSFYANMVANEAFLDSSALRSSTVSIAKQLGYTPRSVKASKIFLDVKFGTQTITNTNGETVEDRVRKGNAFVNRGDIFRATLPGNRFFNFVVLDDYKVDMIGGIATVKNVKAYEGTLRTYTFVVNSFDPTQRFILPSNNIDVDTLRVRIQKSVTDTTGLINIWNKATDVNGLNSDSLVYFLQETEDGNFEIYFGDGIVGKALENGNVISVEYLLTNGELANNCRTFSYVSGVLAPYVQKVDSTGSPSYGVSTISDPDGNPTVSYGGTLPESIESIKYYAPRNYQAQERAVTVEDYKTILVKEFSEGVDSFFVWGGEENDPPQYGKVFISIKPKNGSKIGILEKLAIQKSVLGKRNLVTIQPEIVDPDYIYLEIDSLSAYDPSRTNLSPAGLAAQIKLAVESFETANLDKFGRNFKASKLSSLVDNSNKSITGTNLSIRLQKRIEPFLGKPSPYTIRFNNPLLHPIDGFTSIVSSSAFGYQDQTNAAVVKPVVDAYLDDDGYGNIRIYKIEGTTKVYINTKIGKINYNTGIITLNNFNPQYIEPRTDSEIKITVIPQKSDIQSLRNQIIVLDYSKSNFNVELDSVPTINQQTGAPFPY